MWEQRPTFIDLRQDGGFQQLTERNGKRSRRVAQDGALVFPWPDRLSKLGGWRGAAPDLDQGMLCNRGANFLKLDMAVS